MQNISRRDPVAERLSKIIAENGVKVTWLAERSGIPYSTLNRKLAGHTPFNTNEVAALAESLRVPVLDVLASLTEWRPSDRVAS